jgi:uncharacterized protein YaeQ
VNLRCELTVNGDSRKLLIVQGPNEPEEHLALKLSGYLLFWDHDPIVGAGTKLPALSEYEFLPDLLALDDAGEIALWVECGSSTMNKLNKLTRRLSRGRIVVLQPTAREAERLRQDCEAQLDKPHRIEILAWPGTSFKDWTRAVTERTEIYGESSEASLNAVVNEKPFSIDLARY